MTLALVSGRKARHFDAEQARVGLRRDYALPAALFLGMAFRLHALNPTIVILIG